MQRMYSDDERTVAEVCTEVAECLSGQTLNRAALTEHVQTALTIRQGINEGNFGRELSKCRGKQHEIDRAVACAIYAIDHEFGHLPRPSQVAAVFLFLTKQTGKGIILEIRTGEGKSDIVAMTAGAFAVLTGRKVDIVTSSEVLAVRDAEEYRNFFKQLGLSVADNIKFYNDHLRNREVGRNVYHECDVLYGVTSSFSGDMLRYILYGKQIAKREKAFLIADEVDNMLVDNKDFITKMSGSGNGLKDLQHIRRKIYFLMLAAATSQKDVSEENLVKGVREEILQALESGSLKIKPFYKTLGIMMAETWAQSALQALRHSKLNEDFIIENKKVVPIDKDTGVRMDRTRWQNGLHEFLEIKHGLPIGEDSFTSVYYSNLRFYKDYGAGLCGLTGTVGSQHTCTFLAEAYNVEIFKVPTFKRSKRIDLAPIILSSESEVLDSIAERALCLHLEGRPALVILPTIAKVLEVERAVQLAFSRLQLMGLRIVKYVDGDRDQRGLAKVDGSTIIIATNLAGRGTDIKISDEIDARGGLGVILGYFPQSLRVQEQAFGRTARKGQNGDCGMIALAPCALDARMPSIHQFLEELRNHLEMQALSAARVEIRQKETMDQMFQMICDDVIADAGLKIRDDEALFESMKEQWGVHVMEQELKLRNDSDRPPEIMMEDFLSFFGPFQTGLRNGQLSNNVTHKLMKVDQLIKKGDNQGAARILDEMRANGDVSASYHMKRAMVENNLGHFDAARQAADSITDAARSAVVEFKMTAGAQRNAAVVAEAINIVEADMQVVRNFGGNADLAIQLDGLNVNIMETLDANIANISASHDQETQAEIDAYLTRIQASAEVILNTIATNQEKQTTEATRIKLQPSEQTKVETGQIETIPEPPKPVSPPEPKRSTGFWGFILGAVQIIAGAVLTIVSGGTLAAFGMSMIMNGIDLININIQMNRDGTYDGNAIIRKAIQSTLTSCIALTPTSSVFVRWFPVAAKVGEMLHSHEDSIQAARNIVRAQEATRNMNPPPTDKKVQENIEKAMKSATVSMEERRPFTAEDLVGCTDEQKQEMLNSMLDSWYQTEVKGQLEAISSQKLDGFITVVNAVVAVQRDDWTRRIMSGKSQSFVLMSVYHSFQREAMDSFFAQLTEKCKPSKSFPLHKVALKCGDAGVAMCEGVDFVEGDVVTRMDECLNLFQKHYLDAQFYGWLFMMAMKSSREKMSEEFNAQSAQLKAAIEAFNNGQGGVRSDLEARQTALQASATQFNADEALLKDLRTKLASDTKFPALVCRLMDLSTTTRRIDEACIGAAITSCKVVLSSSEAALLARVWSYNNSAGALFRQCMDNSENAVQAFLATFDALIVHKIHVHLLAHSVRQDAANNTSRRN